MSNTPFHGANTFLGGRDSPFPSLVTGLGTWTAPRTAPRTVVLVKLLGFSRVAARLGGARGMKKVCRPHVRISGLSRANVLCWRKYLRYYWDIWLGTPL